VSRRWIQHAKRQRDREEAAKPQRVHASRLDAAVALVLRRLSEAGIRDGDGFLDVDPDDVSWDVDDGVVFIRVPFRIGKLTGPDVDREFARRR
jgi:hypothetical protein